MSAIVIRRVVQQNVKRKDITYAYIYFKVDQNKTKRKWTSEFSGHLKRYVLSVMLDVYIWVLFVEITRLTKGYYKENRID